MNSSKNNMKRRAIWHFLIQYLLVKSSKENRDILEPLHVESLFLIEGDVLDEGSNFFVDSYGFQELHEGSLESLFFVR